MRRKKLNEKEIADAKGKFLMSSLTIIMMGTLFIYFLWSVINGRYIVNFNIDSIVGAISFVVLVKNLKCKYSILKKYQEVINNFIFIDVASFVICLFIKIIIKMPFDFSLIILLGSYYISKNKFYQSLN